MRRSCYFSPEPASWLQLEAVRVDLARGIVRRPGREPESLSPMEHQLLGFLAQHPREPLSRARLLVEACGYRPGVASRSVDTTMGRLRAKVERAPDRPRHLLGVRGLGYRFEPLEAQPLLAPAESPALPRTNLDHGPTDLFGRAAERAELARALEAEGGLLTVLGPGGMGKTRLARAAALDWLAAGSDAGEPRQAWFVDLVPTREGEGVVAAAASALGLGLQDRRQEAASGVGEALARRGPIVVVLDNVEHVVEPITRLLSAWRAQAPQVRWLLTSRERTHVAGERILDLQPLTDREAEALYASRARAVRPDLDPDDAERAAIRALCARLDRIPLAVELVAARARVLPAATALARLERGLAVTDAAVRPELGRHATLRAAVAWSWELLDIPLRMALVQATVFAGGFDLEAAEDVVVGSGQVDDALELLEQLVDRSLLRSVERDGSPRFELYESIRAFAGEQGAVEALAAARGCHRRAYAAHAAKAERSLMGPRGIEAMAWLRREQHNLRAVLAGREEDPRSAAAAALGLAAMMLARGPFDSLQRVLTEGIAAAVEAGEPEQEVRLRLCRAEQLRRLVRPAEAREELETALRLVPAPGPRALSATIRGRLALLAAEADEPAEASGLYEQALAEAREAGDRMCEAALLGHQSVLRLGEGRFEEARRLGEEALALQRVLGSVRGEGQVLSNLAVIELRARDELVAADGLRRSIELLDAAGEGRDASRARSNLAIVLAQEGRLAEAESLLRRALEQHEAEGERSSIVFAEANLADILLQSGRAAEAERRLRVRFEALHHPDQPLHRGGHTRARAINAVNLALALADQGRLEEALPFAREAARLSQEGRTPEVIPYVVGVLGLVLWLAGEREEGRRQLDRAVAEARRSDQARNLAVFGSAVLALQDEADPELAAEIAAVEAGYQAAAARALLDGRAPPAEARATSVDLRLLGLLHDALVAAAPGPGLLVAQDGGWVQGATGARVALPPGGPGRAVLRRLVEARLAEDGAVPWPTLHDAAWPGIERDPAAALSRLRVALSRLRKVGVEGIEWVDDPGGYRIDPRIPVAWG